MRYEQVALKQKIQAQSRLEQQLRLREMNPRSYWAPSRADGSTSRRASTS